MKIRFDALKDLRLQLILVVMVLLVFQAIAGPICFQFAHLSPTSTALKEPHCAPGCRVCEKSSPEAAKALDEFLLKTGSMEPE